jgi:hypothetical protein
MEAEKEKTEEKPPQEQPQPPQEQPQPQTVTTEVPLSSTEPPANPSELTQEKKDTSKYIFNFIFSYNIFNY